MHKLIACDIKIFRLINESCHCAFLDTIMPWCTLLGSAGFSLAIFLILVLAVPKIHGLPLFSAMAISQCCAHLIKYIGKRNRPHLALPGTRAGLRPSFFDPSFPSAHTAAVTSWAAFCAFAFPAFAPFAIFLIALVAFSRIYMGQHYPSDVLVGAVIGMLPAALIFYR